MKPNFDADLTEAAQQFDLPPDPVDSALPDSTAPDFSQDTPEDFPRVTPEEQTIRNAKRVDILKAELAVATDPQQKEVLNRELYGGETTIYPKAAGLGNQEVSAKVQVEGATNEPNPVQVVPDTPPNFDLDAGVNFAADDVEPNFEADALKTDETTDLLSFEGVAAAGRAVVPSIDRTLAGAELFVQDEAEKPNQNRFRKALDGQHSVTDTLEDKLIGELPTKSVLQRLGFEDPTQKFTKLGKFLPQSIAVDFIDAVTPSLSDLNPFTKQEKLDAQNKLKTATAELHAALPANASKPLQWFSQGLNTAIVQAPALALSALIKNPTPMMAVNAIQELGGAYAQNSATDEFGNRIIPQEAAAKTAVLNMFIGTTLEYIPVSRFLKNLGEVPFLSAAGKFIGQEVSTEVATEFLQAGPERLFINPDQPIGEFMTDLGWRMLETVPITIFGAGLTVGGSAPVTYPLRRREEKKVAKLQEAAQDFDEMQAKNQAEVEAGIDPTDLTKPKHTDIPDAPLTPEEVRVAEVQIQNMKEGADLIPDNPLAAEEAGQLDLALDDPAFRSTDETKRAAEDQIQADLDHGMSQAVAERRANETYPNQLKPSRRPLAYSTDPTQIGLSLSQTTLAPGAVAVLAGNEEQYSEAYTQALGKTVEQWSAKWMPKDSRVVINLSGLTGNAVGAYSITKGTGIHIISPREVVRAQRAETEVNGETTLGEQSGPQGYNTFTQNQTFGAITHEFGHALTMAAFGQRMKSQFPDIVNELDTGAIFDETQLAQMPVEEAGVIREFQTRKASVLDGTMKADALMEIWAGVWKVGNDVAVRTGRRDLYSYAKEQLLKDATLLGRAELKDLPLNQISARDLVHAMGRDRSVTAEQSNQAAETYLLQFNEYMAEQFSRFAHSERIDANTPLGSYFKTALTRLREFFKSLKTTKGVDGDFIIKPGTSFAAWVDSLAKTRAADTATLQKKRGRKRTRPESVVIKEPKKPKARKTKKKQPKPDEKVVKEVLETKPRDLVEDEMNEIVRNPFEEAILRERVKQSIPNARNKDRVEMMELIGKGKIALAKEALLDYNSRQTKKDVKAIGGAWTEDSVNAFKGIIGGFRSLDAQQDDLMLQWWRKTAKRYLNKLAGTKNDPLKDFIVPHNEGGEKAWGEIMDAIIQAESIEEHRQEFPKAPPNTEVWKVTPASYDANGQFLANWTSNEYIAVTSYMRHIGDYLSNNVEIKDLQKYDLVRAFRETQARDAAQKKKMSTTVGRLEGTTQFKSYPEGFQWVNVVSDEALENEGDAMGHCVGGYCDQVKSGNSTIYSLRDPQGQPHVTIEVIPNDFSRTPEEVAQGLPAAPAISQIKGKGNRTPVEEYIPYVQDFIKTGRWSQVREMEEMGMVDIRSSFLGIIPGSEREWTEAVRNRVGNDSPFQILDDIKDIHQEFTFNPDPNYGGPFFDRGSPDSEEVQINSKRIGMGAESVPWQRAVNWSKDFFHYVQQMQQIAHSSRNLGALQFVEAQNSFQGLKNHMMSRGTEVAKKWEKMPKPLRKRMENILQAEYESGGHATELVQDELGNWRHQPSAAFADLLKQHGIQPGTAEAAHITENILNVKNTILDHIQVIENGVIDLIKSQFRRSQLVVRHRSNQIRELANKWRIQPYLPQSNFGNYVIKAYGVDKDGNKALIKKEHFPDAATQDAALIKYQKKYALADIESFKIDEATSMQLALPLDFLETLKDTGEFTDGQLAAIGSAMMPLRGNKAFSKIERDSVNISGASTDMIRNFASWVEDSANFTSKWIFSRRMTASRAMTRSELTTARNAGDIQKARSLQRMLDTMSRAQDLIMHPQAEWFKARSIVALTYLMWAPKTALMNLTGMFQTYAAVTADYGDIKGNKIFAKASVDLLKLGTLNAADTRTLSKAQDQGIIDQGFGYFMSGLANAGNMRRQVRDTLIGKLGRGFVNAGMYPFKAVETANRRVTILTFFRAELERAKERGMTDARAEQHAYQIAASRTRLLQNDYASGNRPPLLTGRKSILMIFLSYPQYMLYIMSGGYERGTRQIARDAGRDPRSVWGGQTMRMWLIFLAMAGVEGVPFGDDMIDFLQMMWKKVFGKSENVRVEAQRFMKDTMGIESQYWRNVVQRGLLHNIGGVDLSGSYSLGSPIPGSKLLLDPHADTWREFIGEAFEEFSGPFGGAIKAPIGLGLEDDIGLKELGKSLPAAAGSVARAADAAVNGLTTSKGDRVLRGEDGEFRDITDVEIGKMTMGFRLSEVADFQEIRALKRQQAEYWTARRLQLKEQFKEGYTDPATRTDLQEVIKQFNREVPYGGLRISGAELSKFIKGDLRRVLKLERGIGAKRFHKLDRDIDEVFSDSPSN